MFKKIIRIFALCLPTLAITGCAAGSATSGYALRAMTADSLSSSAEQHIVDRIKKELDSIE